MTKPLSVHAFASRPIEKKSTKLAGEGRGSAKGANPDTFTRLASRGKRPQLFSQEEAWLRSGLKEERPARTLLMNTLKDVSLMSLAAMDRAKQMGTFADPKKAFSLYRKMRLEALPESLRKPAADYIDERVIAFGAKRLSAEGRSFGYFHPEQKRIELRFPKSLRGSTLEYVTMAHEWEHAIQRLALEQNKVPLASFTFGAWGEHRFWTECGGMMAEAAFASLLRPTILKKAREQMQTSKDVDAEVLPHVLRMLQGGDVDLVRYVHEEHSAGRYDRDTCMKSVLPF